MSLQVCVCLVKIVSFFCSSGKVSSLWSRKDLASRSLKVQGNFSCSEPAVIKHNSQFSYLLGKCCWKWKIFIHIGSRQMFYVKGCKPCPRLCLTAQNMICGLEHRHYLGACWRYTFLHPMPVHVELKMQLRKCILGGLQVFHGTFNNSNNNNLKTRFQSSGAPTSVCNRINWRTSVRTSLEMKRLDLCFCFLF